MTNFRIEYANGSDIGKVRSENQDYFGAYKTQDEHLFIVCDGMGGHEGGAEASKIAVTSIKEYFLNAQTEKSVEQKLKEAIEYANLKIYEVSRQRNYARGMGTTVTAVVVKNGLMYYAHVGDSRIYLFRNGKTIHLTKDHTLVQQLVDMGKLTEKEAEEHPAKHQLLQALGVDEKVFVDVASEPLSLQEGDYILMCSDGLHGYVSEETIRSIVLTPNKKLIEKTEELIQKALQAGGYDNVTVQLIHVIQSSAKKNSTKIPKKTLFIGGGVGLILLLFVILWFLRTPESEKNIANQTSQDTVKQSSVPIPEDSLTRQEDISPEIIDTVLQPAPVPKSNKQDVPDKPKEPAKADKQESDTSKSSTQSPEPTDEKKSNSPKKNIKITTYEVKQGEVLSKIAEKFCVPKEEIMKLNSLSTPDNLQAGTKLKIPVKTEHIVKKGETLSEIAEAHKVSMQKIMEINGINKDKELQAGQKLIIPKCKQ